MRLNKKKMCKSSSGVNTFTLHWVSSRSCTCNSLVFFNQFSVSSPQEWYAEYSRECLPQGDENLNLDQHSPVTDPAPFQEHQLNSQSGLHSIN